jgi:uncharacterized glyoxalase superfamily metalloenzyme YdcJ
MIRKSKNRFANFVAKFIWRHSVTVTSTTEYQAEIASWIADNVGKFEVWVNYNFTVHTDDQDLITSVSNTNKIEYRFLNVSSAVMFKLTFCDSLAH